MKVTVFSAIFGDYDNYRAPLNPNPNVDYVLFTDRSVFIPEWNVKVIKTPYPRRKAARYYKLLPHIHLPDADYTIWIDGWFQIKDDPMKLLDFLGDNDIAMEMHRERDCIYEECEEVIRQSKANPEQARAQVAKYKKEGYPAHNGLTASYAIVRKNTPQIAEMENMWWDELNRETDRDQLSFCYVMWKLGMECSSIPCVGMYCNTYPHAGSY